MIDTCGGGGYRPIKFLGRIEAGRKTDGADSADRGVAICAPLERQWDGVRGAGVEGIPLPTIWHQSTQLVVPL